MWKIIYLFKFKIHEHLNMNLNLLRCNQKECGWSLLPEHVASVGATDTTTNNSAAVYLRM